MATTRSATAADSEPPAPAPTAEPTPVSWAEAIATAPGTLECSDAIDTAPGRPVLLVHGTAMTPAENWATSYAPFLAARGRPVCTVALPSFGTGDVQQSIAKVATAMAHVVELAGRPIDVLGHSQGAYLPRAALRLHPDLGSVINDVVGIAGVYEAGSEQLATRCAKAECIPAMRQLARGSHLLLAIARMPLPVGPDYSNIGSLGDTNITPQPIANEQVGAISVLVQEVCSGRQMDGYDHALLAGDAVAAALVMDALDHDGPVDASRVSPDVCATVSYDGFDREVFMTGAKNVGPRIGAGQVPAEPTVACRLLVNCRDLRTRGRLLHATTSPVTQGRVPTRWMTVRATATTNGSVMVRVGSRPTVRQASSGDVVNVRIALGNRRVSVTVLTRAAGDNTWVIEHLKVVPRR